MRRNWLEYTPLLAYCPDLWNDGGPGQTAAEFVKRLKNNQPYNKVHFPSDIVAKLLKLFLENHESLKNVFHNDMVLVPVPRASPIREGDLWPAYEIANSISRLGLGRVSPLLERVKGVNPSSRSSPKARPTPTQHFESLSVRRNLSQVEEVVLVDDVITRGHTLIACAWRIEEAYPGIKIHAFAAVRTVSNKQEFKGFFDPVELGRITYRRNRDDCLRRP